MLPKVTAFFSSLGQNLALYEKFKLLSQDSAFSKLNSAQKKVIENSLRDFRLGGAELSDADKPRFAEIQDEQALLGKAFSDHVLDATDEFIHLITDDADLTGLPEDAVAAAADLAQRKNLQGWAFSLHFPSYYPVMQYSENRSLRRLMYEAYVTRASELAPQYSKGKLDWDNTQNMLEQLKLRDEEAHMLGFKNYADLSLAPKMASTVEEVDTFLTNFAQKAKPFALKDWQELSDFAKTELSIANGLEPWDIAYASERLKQERYSFSENELKQYFPLPKVLEGLFGVIETLFGVKIEKADLPTWHTDVQSFSVKNATDKTVAYFYLDPYARSGKRGGAWMDDARGRRELPDGEIQIPVAYLVCNFAPPVKVNSVLRQPTITHDDVITLFHESGHGLHHLLTQVSALGVSGINGVEWDAVELPSQFMENFCWEWEVLEKMTAHAETGKPLFSSHMIDLSEEPIEENIEICKSYLARMSKMGMTLEIELGITGGEEDGVDNSDVDSSKLYTQPSEVSYAYEELLKVSPRFTIAASFGNVHGVYKPGNVKLTPKILKNSQDYFIVEVREGILMDGPILAHYVIHKNQEL
jgi:oligopeptidase A